MDQKRRIGLYQQANQVIQEDGPYVFLFQPLYQYGVRRNIDGFYPPPSFDLWKLYTISKN